MRVLVVIALLFVISACDDHSQENAAPNIDSYSDEQALKFRQKISSLALPADGNEILGNLGIDKDVATAGAFFFSGGGDSDGYILVEYRKLSESYLLMLVQTNGSGGVEFGESDFGEYAFSDVFIGELGEELVAFKTEDDRKSIEEGYDVVRANLGLVKE